MPGTMDETELKVELPWLVNGSLDAAQRERVQAAVRAAPGLQDEQRFLERLRAAVREDDAAGPGELGWRRLRRQIEAESQTAVQQRQRRRWQGLAIAASVLMAAQLAWFWSAAPHDDGHYMPMAAPPVVPGAVVLQLRFRPEAPLAQIEALLQRQGLRVIDGPGAAGVWRVQLQGGDAAQVLQALQAERSLIESAARD